MVVVLNGFVLLFLRIHELLDALLVGSDGGEPRLFSLELLLQSRYFALQKLFASTLFGGPFGSDLAERLDENMVLGLLDAKGVKEEYSRALLLVALKRAARQASGS